MEKSVTRVEETSAKGVVVVVAPHKTIQDMVVVETEEDQTVAVEATMAPAEMLVTTMVRQGAGDINEAGIRPIIQAMEVAVAAVRATKEAVAAGLVVTDLLEVAGALG